MITRADFTDKLGALNSQLKVLVPTHSMGSELSKVVCVVFSCVEVYFRGRLTSQFRYQTMLLPIAPFLVRESFDFFKIAPVEAEINLIINKLGQKVSALAMKMCVEAFRQDGSSKRICVDLGLNVDLQLDAIVNKQIHELIVRNIEKL